MNNGSSDSAPMSSVDLAWLRMERPTNPMMVVGVLTLVTPLRLAAVRAVLAGQLPRYERLLQKPVDGVLGGRWERDPEFNLNDHVRPLTLAGRAGQPELEAAVSKLASTPLNSRKPMWQFHVVAKYRKGSAVIVRIHHCYADGMALVRLLLSLTNSPAMPHADSSVAAHRKPVAASCTALLEPVMHITGGFVQGTLDLWASSLHMAAHPDLATQRAKQGVAFGSELAKMVLLSNDPLTPLKGSLSSRKQLAWSSPLPLEEVKTISRALGCTVNDALLSTIAGALGAYLRHRQYDTDNVVLRALVPVNLRPPDSPVELGNYFGLVFVDLPVGLRNPLARLYAVHHSMEALKQSPQAMLAYWMLTTVGALPQVVEDYTLEMLTAKASIVVSNVIGPLQPLYFAGAKIDQLFFWVPQAGSIGAGISALTYNNQVHFGIMADSNLVADPAVIVAKFNDEFEKLVLCTISGIPAESP